MTTAPPKKKKNLYLFNVSVPATLSFRVHATSLEKAIKVATDGHVRRLCLECREVVSGEWCLGDFDANPGEGRLEHAECTPHRATRPEGITEEALEQWPSPAVPEHWNTMATAPKDGRLFIACFVFLNGNLGPPTFAQWRAEKTSWYVDGDPRGLPESPLGNWFWCPAPSLTTVPPFLPTT